MRFRKHKMSVSAPESIYIRLLDESKKYDTSMSGIITVALLEYYEKRHKTA